MNHRSPVAIVDVGSASMQLVIAEMKEGRIHILHREKKLARLAEGRTASGSLKANFKETLKCTLADFVQRAHEFGVVPRISATATLRSLRDREKLVGELALALGAPIEILSGFDEARLVWRGVLHGHPRFGHCPTLTVDVGGGSTELLGAFSEKPSTVASIPIGSLVTHRRWLGFDVTRTRRIEHARSRIKRLLAGALTLSSATLPEFLIATGGTIQRLVRVVEGRVMGIEEMDGYQLTRDALVGCVATLCRAKTPAGRRSLPGIDTERADFLLGGAIIYQEVLDALNGEAWIISTSALRTGLLLREAESA